MEMETRAPDEWIETWTGRQFWPFDPRPSDIHLPDMAHHLATRNRFNGACFWPYSSAEHSCRVAMLAGDWDGTIFRNVPAGRQGLLHDGTDAYFPDVPSPIKRRPELAPLLAAEAHLQGMIFERYGCAREVCSEVRYADFVLLATEKRDLMAPEPASWGKLPPPLVGEIVPLNWKTAETDFLRLFAILWPRFKHAP